MFGSEPSVAAQESLILFKKKNIKNIVELGAGLGRDTIFFAKNSIHVQPLDYSPSAIKKINSKAKNDSLSNFISTKKLSSDSPFLTLTFSGLVGAIIISLFVTIVWISPSYQQWIIMIALASFGTLGHFFLILSLFFFHDLKLHFDF